MVWKAIRQGLERLSIKAISQKLEKRRLQQELDFHRLFLITRHYQDVQQGLPIPASYAQALNEEASQLGLEGLQSEVANAIQAQLEALLQSRYIESPSRAFMESAFPSPPAAIGLGLGVASPSSSAIPMQDPISATSPSSIAAAASFRLRLGPSSIQHASAGQGVWLRGKACTGQVVALYPGVAYRPLYHRHIPGYPMIAQQNEYLISRYDGVVVDAKPWVLGTLAKPQNQAEAALLKLREVLSNNDLAAGHMINHPPAGADPNVVLAPFDWISRDGSSQLRAYIPNVEYTPEERSGYGLLRNPVPGLALVATRILEDEELYLNYRLNPNLPSLPDWYTPVDADEDARRWS